MKINPQTGRQSWCCFATKSIYSAINNSGAWGFTRAKQSHRMGKKPEFLLLIVAWWGQFIRIKARVVPFFILFRIRCNAIFGIPLGSALAILLVGRTLDVTFALKPRQEGLLKFAARWVCTGLPGSFQVLVVLRCTFNSQSGKILLPAATVREAILEDVTVGSGPTFDLGGAFFSHFRKENLL